LLPGYPPGVGYGMMGSAYGALGAGYVATGFTQVRKYDCNILSFIYSCFKFKVFSPCTRM